VKFIHLPRRCTIRVFTLSGDLITTIDYEAPPDQPDKGEVSWNLLSASNRALASGVYVYAVESDFGRQIGKFVLIR
jgi:endo-alpha-1,4-polygalactosaminidase (GH114 family)